MKKVRVLFLLKSSNYHKNGLYEMCSYVKESQIIMDNFYSKYLLLYVANSKNKLLYIIFSFFNLIKYAIKLIFILLFSRPKIIYFAISPVKTFYRDLVYIFLIKLFNIKLIYHLHGKGINKFAAKNRINLMLYKWAYKNVVVICLSPLLKGDISDIYNGTIHIVNNGLKTSAFHLRKKQENPLPILLYLSNLIKSKGVFDYIEAVRLLVEKKAQFKAFIAGGKGDTKPEILQNLINKYKLNNYLELLGPLYGQEKTDMMLQSDIFVFPTYYETETWGLVIMEAMEAGLPVISTPEAAIPEIVDDGVTGFLVKKKQPDQIAEKILILINNPILRKQMGFAGRKKLLEKYTVEIFEKKLVEALKTIIKKI